MSLVKSDLIKELADNYPNFLRKDLTKLVDIILYEVQASLKRGERVELRDTMIFEAKSFKARYARDPRNNQKVFVPDRKLIKFKISKKWQREINEK